MVLPSENICKNCHVENITFKSEVNFKKAVLTAPAKLNAPVKFTSPDRIKLTLQQKRLECKQLEGNFLYEEGFGLWQQKS